MTLYFHQSKPQNRIFFSFFSARAGDEPTGVGILATADVGPVRAYERTGGALILLSGRAHGKDDIQGRPCSAHAAASPRPGKKLYPFKSLLFCQSVLTKNKKGFIK